MLVELLKDELVEEREALWGVVTTQHSLVQAVLEHVEVATERDEVSLHLGCDLLALAAGAEAVPRTMVTVPVLVTDDIIETVIEVRLQAEGAELPFAFILYALFLSGFAHTSQLRWRITLE